MYALSGLIQLIKADLFMLALALIMLTVYIIRRIQAKKKHKKTKKGEWISVIFVLVASLSLTGVDVFTVCYPTVETCSGYFVEEYRDPRSRVPLNKEYVFDLKDGGLKQVFYLDLTSKKKIFPEDFVEGEYYRITYEKRTKVILQVEKLPPPNAACKAVPPIWMGILGACREK